ncbi:MULTISPECIES: DEAD/DEAH box helicase family protein [unclassified Halomonas]|uniref:EcoAI/FtnUII family type I restriction enzme subunit R n=1 Tax=unclassified Halomonas TaxID=2609666 RepID=UPI001EF66D74|nr:MULTISPECIES: DEAD/DEAH box helicase family protein [unclassified Halomonas]MCG7590012.1 DEAD/DEAH box helicase family protein [Halomonas sp. McD50-5]MCG7615938.1 DEAD/DEAH box helicase family protein [Halomonas sp. McD50-4]
MTRQAFSERDICTKYITPAIQRAGWDIHTQVREEYPVSDGRITVRGRMHHRAHPRRADYVLSFQKNQPIAVIEAKDASHSLGHGMQQAQAYAEKLDVPFAISSNGSGFLFSDPHRLVFDQAETTLPLDQLPGPDALWHGYRRWKGLSEETRPVVEQPFYDDGSGRTPRYYQMVAVNRTVEAIAKGQDRLLLVMATGTGKTYTAFQLIWRLWKAGRKQRILFLADRNVLVDQTKSGDFKPFGAAMTKITKRQVEKSHEIYLSLYQAVTGSEEEQNIYKQFSPDFFDLIVIDECHRGSAAEDSAWRAILDYFSGATHIGLTATPKETTEVSNIHYFGEPIYTYSLKQGIDDGYLAPYKVIRVDLDRDLQGWRPSDGQTDIHGEVIEDRIYNQRDFDRNLILTQRTELVARTITDYLTQTDPMQKTIVFCENIDHAERMRQALVNLNPEHVAKNRKYVMRITGDELEGKAELDHFIDPEEPYPVIAVTSKLMTTGVDAKTCKLIVLDQRIQSMTEFKQIIGRGTRIDAEHDKFWFTILDFRKATELFADPAFDGEPEKVYVPGANDPLLPIEDDDTEDTDDGSDPTDEDVVSPDDESPTYPSPTGEDDEGLVIGEPRRRYIVDNVTVAVIGRRVQYMGPDGKLITEELTDYTRKTVRAHYATLSDFLRRWEASDRKQAVLDELAEQGVFWEDLTSEVEKTLGDAPDPFDAILHIVYGQPALTRRQRAAKARQSDYFERYEGQARAVLDALLDKYADNGVATIEDTKVLQMAPLDRLGTVVELADAFGGKTGYREAVRELEMHIYAS